MVFEPSEFEIAKFDCNSFNLRDTEVFIFIILFL
jgi:hypothetical protein